MQTFFIPKKIKYDGSQLAPLYSYLNHKILGDSIISWIGACDVSFANMKDGEDLISLSPIRGQLMLHFIIEIFDQNLFSGVSCQRLFASIVKDYLNRKAAKALGANFLLRDGDDIFLKNRKLSISIASCSAVSTQVHFAMNISNKGTPVPTLSLEDLNLSPKEVATEVMQLWSKEYQSIRVATQKVKPL